MFAAEYLGIRANSAAMRPRLVVMLRITCWRWLSVHSGNASRRLNSAVLRSFGESTYSTWATFDASQRAAFCGKTSSTFSETRTAAYSNHSFIAADHPLPH